MRFILTLLLFTAFYSLSFCQEIYTSRIGSKFFPGHLDIVISTDNTDLRYEVFNHWYYGLYSELRQMTIPLDSLNNFNATNDSIKILLSDKCIKLTDKKFKLNKSIKHVKLCVSADIMRKISFADKLSSQHDPIRHYELYETEDLNLSETEFRQIVLKNLDMKINNALQ